MQHFRWLLTALVLIGSYSLSVFAIAAELLPEVTAGAQALSLEGEALYSPEPSDATWANLAVARAEYEANPDNADNIVWLGRRVAYAGDYRSAIEVFSEGIGKFPADPRFYRHRGHRYISIRDFDRAIADFEKAAELMQGLPIQVEPDGLPNAQNIPLTTTQGNVWYHLGLAYYLKQDWSRALSAFRNGYNLGGNDDNLVSTGHWIYMILRRMGNEAEAADALRDITADMNIIENMSYHELCLLYKGEMEVADMMAANGDDPSNAAVAYGIANYYYYNGDRQRSDEMLQRIVSGSSWSSFGFIAAEADLANSQR
jgi:tetratricopeptide (TPR) repeat protein